MGEEIEIRDQVLTWRKDSSEPWQHVAFIYRATCPICKREQVFQAPKRMVDGEVLRRLNEHVRHEGEWLAAIGVIT